jgi:hypothetical protein
MRTSDDTMKWVWRGSAAIVLLIGWIFIYSYNHGHVTPPVVFVGLGYLAGIATIYNLFRTGASAVAPNVEEDGAAWGLPLGTRGELEREKRTLLKAIKEAEFDHQMGKLSKADVDQMIGQYRSRAIAVIKMLEDPGTKQGGTVREQIQREVRARLEVEGGRQKAVELGNRKNQKKAAAAAKLAARAAAAAGASGQVAAAMAAAAAVNTDDDADDEVPASAEAEVAEPAEVAAKPAEVAAKPDEVAAKPDEAIATSEVIVPTPDTADTSDARDKEAAR